MKTKWKFGLVAIVLILVAAGYGYRQYTRGNKDLEHVNADLTIAAPDLLAQYTKNENSANKQYLNKVIDVRGVIKSIDRDSAGSVSIGIDGGDPLAGVSCELDKAHTDQAAALKVGDSVSVNGVCTGMLTDVVLVRCAVRSK